MARAHTRIDDRGFVVFAFTVPNPHDKLRKGLPWTEAEDRFLFRRLRHLEGEGDTAPTKTIAREIQRSRLAVETRFQALRAGIRLARSKR